jgi:lipopolysaccharide/colanic/teichoic acid biosynthesis glycosyltransferase
MLLLFRQPRIGLHGKPFMLYKLKTMRDPRPGEDPLATDAIRITRLGRFLRTTSLDELPNLWNVLKGDMALVGPRPLLPEYLPLYTPDQMRRHEVKPGITGWAQVNGRNAISWEEKFRLDVWYVDNRSFWLDCKILWMTVWQVLTRRNVSAAGHATIPPFQRNRLPSA